MISIISVGSLAGISTLANTKPTTARWRAIRVQPTDLTATLEVGRSGAGPIMWRGPSPPNGSKFGPGRGHFKDAVCGGVHVGGHLGPERQHSRSLP